MRLLLLNNRILPLACPLLVRALVFFLLQTIEQPIGILAHKISDLAVQFFACSRLFFISSRLSLVGHIVGAGLFVLITIHRLDAVQVTAEKVFTARSIFCSSPLREKSPPSSRRHSLA